MTYFWPESRFEKASAKNRIRPIECCKSDGRRASAACMSLFQSDKRNMFGPKKEAERSTQKTAENNKSTKSIEGLKASFINLAPKSVPKKKKKKGKHNYIKQPSPKI